MQKLILCFVSLSVALSAWTTGIRPLNLDITSDNEMPIPHPSFPASSTTSGWTDLHLDELRDEPGDPIRDQIVYSSAQTDLIHRAFDRPTPARLKFPRRPTMSMP